MRRRTLLETLVIFIVISMFAFLLVGCDGNSAATQNTETTTVIKETQNTSAVTTTVEQICTTSAISTADEPIMETDVEKEIREWEENKSKLCFEAYPIISKVEDNEVMTGELFHDIVRCQFKFDEFREMSRKTLSNDAYKKLYSYLDDDNFWQPLVYANQKFYLPAHCFVTSCWSDNVIIPENNKNYDQDRVYTLRDQTKCGFLLLEPTENSKRLVVIEPGDAYYHRTHFE